MKKVFDVLWGDMAEKKELKELRVIDEEAEDEKAPRLRLHDNSVEEVLEDEVVRIGTGEGNDGDGSFDGFGDEERRRSNEPDIGALIEGEGSDELEDGWQDSRVRALRIPTGWVVLVSGIFAVGIVWALLALKSGEVRQEEARRGMEAVLEMDEEEEKEMEDVVMAIENVVRNFLRSSSVEGLLEFSRDSDRIRPLVEDYYMRHDLGSSRIERFTAMSPLTLGNRGNFWAVGCDLEDGADRLLLVELVNGGVAKVDWESYVCHQPMDWEVFVKERPEGYAGDFRVYLEPDNFYAHEFSDSGKYASTILTTRGSEEFLFGYVVRDSEMFQRLLELSVSISGRKTPLILRLKVPEEARSRRGVLIEKLVSPRWVYMESPVESTEENEEK